MTSNHIFLGVKNGYHMTLLQRSHETNKDLANFSTEPDLHAFPARSFQKSIFIKEDEQLFIQSHMNDIDLTNIKTKCFREIFDSTDQREKEN
jgi:hypothetical protein